MASVWLPRQGKQMMALGLGSGWLNRWWGRESFCPSTEDAAVVPSRNGQFDIGYLQLLWILSLQGKPYR